MFNRAQTLRLLSTGTETPSADPELPETPAEEVQENSNQNVELEEAKVAFAQRISNRKVLDEYIFGCQRARSRNTLLFARRKEVF